MYCEYLRHNPYLGFADYARGLDLEGFAYAAGLRLARRAAAPRRGHGDAVRGRPRRRGAGDRRAAAGGGLRPRPRHRPRPLPRDPLARLLQRRGARPRRGDRRARRPEDRADLPQHARRARPPLRHHPLRPAAARARRRRSTARYGRDLAAFARLRRPEARAWPDLPSLTVAVSTRGARALGLDARGLAGRARASTTWCWCRRPTPTRRSARRSTGWRRGPTSPSCGSPPPGSRAAATPRSTPPAASILLLADDDVTHPPGAYAGIRRFFAENPGLDLFVGRSLDPDGRPRKRPLPRRRRLTRLNAARASSHEIALRLAPVRAAGACASTRASASAPAPTATPRRGVRLPRRRARRRAPRRARPAAGQRAPARELGLRLGGRGPGPRPRPGLRPGLRPRRARSCASPSR